MSDWQNGGLMGPGGADESIEQALAFIRTDRLDEAKVICERLVEENGDDGDALYALGWIALRQGRRQDAMNLLGRVVGLKPDHSRAHNNLGTLLMASGDRAAALRHFEAAVAAEPTLADAHGNLGAARLAEGRVEEARASFERAVELEPDNPSALTNLATVKSRQGEVEAAVADYEKVIALAPTAVEAYNNLAHDLRRAGRSDDALAVLGRGIEANPQAAGLLTNRAIIHYESGDHDAAVAEYDRALAAGPGDPRAAFLRAFPLLAQGRFADGWTAYLNRPGIAAVAGSLHRTPLAADLSGAVIVLHSEGSLAEDLLFLRFVPELVRRGAKVLASPGPLAGFLSQSMTEIGGIAGQGESADALRVAPGDLPYLLGMADGAELPPPARLTSDQGRVAAIAGRLAAAGPAPYVGVTWRRLGASGRDVMPLETLGKALGAAGGTIVMVQPEAAPDAAERLAAGSGGAVADLSDVMSDPGDALALMASLGDYVTVNDAGLHLRLAAGQTARILVPSPPGYLFARAADESPWFPGCALYRAAARESWDAALQSLAAGLAANG